MWPSVNGNVLINHIYIRSAKNYKVYTGPFIIYDKNTRLLKTRLVDNLTAKAILEKSRVHNFI